MRTNDYAIDWRDIDGLETALIVITAERAKAILSRNYADNRAIRKSQVDRYADMMRKGEWSSFTSMLVIDSSGNLIDGQHRLAAQVESGETVGYVVLTGVPTSSYRVIDSGVRRRTQDRAAVNSVEAAIGAAMLQYQNGAPIRKCLTSVSSGSNIYATEQEHISFCSENAYMLSDMARLYQGIRKSTGYLSTMAFGTFISIAREKYPVDYMDFVHELTKWNTTCQQAMAAFRAFASKPNGRGKTPLEQTVILTRSLGQFAAGYIPSMPTKSVATEKQLE